VLKFNKITAALTAAMVGMVASSTVYGATPDPYTGTEELSLKKIARYESDKGKIAKNGVEIVSYDASTNKAFIVNGDKRSLEIIDLAGIESDSTAPMKLDYEKRIVIEGLKENFVDVTSIAIHPEQDLVAVAVLAEVGTKGNVAFFNKNGEYLNHVEVGYHPDMVTFTPDGTKLLVANEGEPSEDYAIDPVGSVTMIDVTDGAAGLSDASKVNDITFDGLKAEDIDSHVRIYPLKNGVYQKSADLNGNNWSVDFEPEYITVDAANKYAYVTLQENNAVAKLDLAKGEFEHVYGFGYKDHSLTGNGMDISDREVSKDEGKINIQRWPVLGAYMPDGMSIYESNGKTYLVSANEGDAREWGEEDWYEERRVKDIKDELKLNAANYKGFTQAELDELTSDITDSDLGRLKVTIAKYMADNGETGKAVHDALYSFGARSFSIWDIENIAQGPVYDSGDSFEQITAKLYPEGFNSNNENNDDDLAPSFDSRSTGKGPEPEDVKIGNVNGKNYAFIGLERIGGIMVYDVDNAEDPHFVTYAMDRDFEADKLDNSFDLGPEGINFVPAEKSSTGVPLLLVANETSGSLSVYEIVTADSNSNSDSYTDTASHWAKAEIDQLSSKQIVQGMTESTFAPDAIVTRAQFTTFMVRALGLVEGAATEFTDVAANEWYSDAIAAALDAKLVSGYENGTFQPNKPITRQELAVLINNALAYLDQQHADLDVEQVLAAFEDQVSIASWAKQAVAQVKEAGITDGKGEGRFEASAPATRAEAAVMINRLLLKAE
jgi:DNA-binding beta-propeller fold protein YncE